MHLLLCLQMYISLKDDAQIPSAHSWDLYLNCTWIMNSEHKSSFLILYQLCICLVKDNVNKDSWNPNFVLVYKNRTTCSQIYICNSLYLKLSSGRVKYIGAIAKSTAEFKFRAVAFAFTHICPY